MNISEGFIRRPIATSLLMAAIALFGTVAYRSLPVSDLPNVDFPTLLVTAQLPGAGPDTMGASVATPLENQFSMIAGLESMQIGINEVEAALRNWNVNVPTGAIVGPHKAFTLQATGQLMNADQYRSMVITYRNGAPVRLEQLGAILDGVEDQRTASWFYDHESEQRAITLGIQRQPGTNTID